MHDAFIALVRARRGDRLKEDELDLFSGAFWSAGRAAALGLIDGVAEPRAFLRKRFGEDVKLKKIPTDGRSVLTRMLSGRGRSPMAAAAEDLLALAETRALWSRYGL